ncbi:unnamed protein product [Thlaspi arvense]|uniref:Uncharacterized protein n=1 Tax=Thlaspi arvense TaxID=13288 RepID=A0AAU9SK93_THLAR|nr:unnamed protein product [Thlaspi arvense]
MASTCIGDCLNIKSDVDCVRPGTTYATLYKWPEAEVEFVRSISRGGSQSRRSSVAVDSIYCRQMYLRSYTFSVKEDNKDAREDQDGNDVGDTRNERKCSKGREDQDGNEAGDRRNERSCSGGRERKRAVKNSRRTSKTMPHRAFVERLIWKCFSCVFSTKVNVE